MHQLKEDTPFQMKIFLRDTLLTIVLTVVIFFVVQATVQVSIVNGSSMEPRLHDGQRIVVNKASYMVDQPQRGDIVVFRPPQNVGSTPFIKRIIGLPGDTVEIKKGIVYVNGYPLDEPYIEDAPAYTLTKEEITGENYFVLGDNRNNTSDSHVWGTVPQTNIIGKAWISIWPPDTWGTAPNHAFDE